MTFETMIMVLFDIVLPFVNKKKTVLIGIIGGSGLYHLDNLTFMYVDKTKFQTITYHYITQQTSKPGNSCVVTHLQIQENFLKFLHQPWGYPSSPITIASLPSPSNTLVAFIARHGPSHALSPSSVPSRANISALKSLGIRTILAFSAVGSLREEISPGSFILPTQIIDRTKGIRPVSFFEDTGIVAHAMFGEPFSGKLVKWLEGSVKRALGEGQVKLFTDKCIVCMEGPQFSTRAESLMYRQWGGDLINMSVLPEAKLAREAELRYFLFFFFSFFFFSFSFQKN